MSAVAAPGGEDLTPVPGVELRLDSSGEVLVRGAGVFDGYLTDVTDGVQSDLTVAMASVASFLTPIGHHGNLLIYGPGRYQFSDFLRVGTPLTLVVAIIVTWMTVLLWGG